MKKLELVAAALLIVGGLNWGLVALAEFDLVAWIFGEDSARRGPRPAGSSTASWGLPPCTESCRSSRPATPRHP